MGSCLKPKKNRPSPNPPKQNPEIAYKPPISPQQDIQYAPENVAESRFPFRETNHLNINDTKNGVGIKGKDDKSDQTNHLNITTNLSPNGGGGKNIKEDKSDISEEDPRTLPFNKREKKEVPKLE